MFLKNTKCKHLFNFGKPWKRLGKKNKKQPMQSYTHSERRGEKNLMFFGEELHPKLWSEISFFPTRLRSIQKLHVFVVLVLFITVLPGKVLFFSIYVYVVG